MPADDKDELQHPPKARRRRWGAGRPAGGAAASPGRAATPIDCPRPAAAPPCPVACPASFSQTQRPAGGQRLINQAAGAPCQPQPMPRSRARRRRRRGGLTIARSAPAPAALHCVSPPQVQVSNSPVYTTGRRLGKGGFGQVFLGTRSQKSRSAKDNKPVEVGAAPRRLPTHACGRCRAPRRGQPDRCWPARAWSHAGLRLGRVAWHCDRWRRRARPAQLQAAAVGCTTGSSYTPTRERGPALPPPCHCRWPSSSSTTPARAAPPMARPTSGPSTSEAPAPSRVPR